MNQVTRGNRKKVVEESTQHIKVLFDAFKLNHQEQDIEYTTEMIQVCSFYNLSTSNNTGILYTIIGICSRLEMISIIKTRSTFKTFKSQYKKLVKGLNPNFPHWRIFSDCCGSPVTYDNNHISKSLFNGMIPGIKLNCGESESPLYKKRFDLSHFKAKLNGIEVDLMYHELIQYLTGCILPFKKAVSLTIKSSWINQEYFRSTDALVYFVLCTRNDERFYKMGITRGSIANRFDKIPYNSKVIQLLKCSLMTATWIENKLHKLNAAYSYEPELSFAGEQECYRQVSKQSFKEVGLI